MQYELQEHRTFLYGLLARDPLRRGFILWQWLKNYSIKEGSTTESTTNLRQVWRNILEIWLWQPSQFVVESSLFLLIGPAFPIRYEWLTTSERRNYMVGRVFAQRKQLFSTVQVLRNNTVHLEGFIHDSGGGGGSIDSVWRRQWVRDVASWVAVKEGQVALEFNCAVQQLAIERGDVFLSELFATLMGHGLVKNLPCWGHGALDKIKPREEEEGISELKMGSD